MIKFKFLSFYQQRKTGCSRKRLKQEFSASDLLSASRTNKGLYFEFDGIRGGKSLIVILLQNHLKENQSTLSLEESSG